ncbi:MAG: 3-isopropylmalate dehydratase large subunit [Gammaproteobacteria bacterium]|nr:3-isopropylmalate dehydratase large subunit [Gammaproteobacteria bacterium]
MKKTLYDKLWDEHHIHSYDNGYSLIYIDKHLIHEVTSPQAFEGLRQAERDIWSKKSIMAVPDHNVPTTLREGGIKDPISKIQVDALNKNCKNNDLLKFDLEDIRQGIVHVVGPEQGIILPGMTVVCGDSHTSTHGALAALAFGIGTSEVEHVLATQCLLQKKSLNMNINIIGEMSEHFYSKDLALLIISKIGTAGGTGCAIEYTGSAIRNLSMEARMTLCNMTIEAGATTGLVAVDDKTISYVDKKPYSPKDEDFLEAKKYWKELVSDKEAIYDKTIDVDISKSGPMITWGTSPEMAVNIDGKLPDLEDEMYVSKKQDLLNAFSYMGLKEKQNVNSIELDKIFIGSCTNSRIEDLRIVADIVKNKKIANNIKSAIIVPGSGLVKEKAEKEGLDKVFLKSGFEWRSPGCSMCLGMNDDKLSEYERCASTSNRNFEGRQGRLSRTHLVSPATAAAAAIHGHFVDVRDI